MVIWFWWHSHRRKCSVKINIVYLYLKMYYYFPYRILFFDVFFVDVCTLEGANHRQICGNHYDKINRHVYSEVYPKPPHFNLFHKEFSCSHTYYIGIYILYYIYINYDVYNPFKKNPITIILFFLKNINE